MLHDRRDIHKAEVMGINAERLKSSIWESFMRPQAHGSRTQTYLKWSESKEHTWRYQRQMSKSKSHPKINVIYMKRENE